MPLDVSLTTPFSDAVALVSLHGEEGISRPFSFQLELSSANSNLDFSQILGKRITIAFSLPGGQTRNLNGVVTTFSQGAQSENGSTAYFARIEPWFALLRMNADQRIFQNLSVPDILEQVFSGLGLTDYKNSLTGTYPAREYCVQYGETTFDFVSRLMESEGIFYFFTHTASAHTLVLADDAGGFISLPGIDTIRYNQTGRTWETIDVMTEGNIEQNLVPIKVAADDFNFTIPTTDLFSISQGQGPGDFAAALSLYRYPGLFATKNAGETSTGTQLSSCQSEQLQLRGSSMCRAFQSGSRFTLAGHFRATANTAYILRSVAHHLDNHSDTYSNHFIAFPSTTVFRPPEITPRAVIRGSQTAIVVGKSGEEIWTDQYGRIKVKFHWDQSAAQDETSSCWIRVAQGWAGQQWGSFFLPRIGQEVIVSFLDGNPDRPIVTGCVYNGQQTTPYSLPDEQTKSTIKSNSSKGGSGFNELRFEDKKGSEEIFIQAQKDMNVSVLGDQSVTVTNNRTITVSEKDETLTVSQGNRTVGVTQGNETHTVGGKRDLTVTGDESHTNSAKFTQNVTGDFALTISGNLSIKVDGSVSIQSGTSFENQAGTSLTNKSGTSLTNQAGTSMSNEAQTTMSSKANASHSVESSGILEIKGSLVKIN
ncbi:MAG TPA: type VI secretion system tip protein TssI/VgrG [Edaphobacter sp.]|nr:type VI secretion system tip protein TssI/VgrG [Edaphobacter sp.]